MKTKHLLSLAAVFLIAAIFLPLSAMTEAKAEGSSVIGNVSMAYTDLGLQMGYSSDHGNNQTRIAYTSSGVYVSCPTDDFEEGLDPYSNMLLEGSHYVLYVIRPDGSVKLLFEDEMYWVAAGTTTNVHVDKNEDIWVVTCWDEGSGFFPLIAWQYDVSEDKVTKYETVGYYNRGSGYGKPVSIIDAVNNKIYVAAFSGQNRLASGRILWTTFDIETKTWQKNVTCVKAPCSCFYHFGYADGKGGFYFVTSRTIDNETTPTNIEGLTVRQAMDRFHNRIQTGANQVWDETYVVYVPDASGTEIYAQCLGDAQYDVENGIYPLVINRSSDAFYDESSGLLYALRLEQDCGVIGYRLMLYVFDTNHLSPELSEGHVFPLIASKELKFSYGTGVNYFPRLVEDTEDNLYIVTGNERVGEIEIWRAVDEIGTEYQLVFSGGIDPYFKNEEYGTVHSLISATSRNNSMRSDTVYFLYTAGHGWESFSVDFAVLREQIGQ
ncbi:MAG: hypothetical protein II797_02530 [Clostridia bacterium]|nr:hypothetical protein [Clostridia bacterium]